MTFIAQVTSAKVYYHGTGSTFEKFTRKGTGNHGLGFYFTPNKQEAKVFAKTLYGAGEKENNPRIIEVALSFKKPFNTMSVENAEQVAKHFGLTYRKPRFAGGATEHYHALEKQLRAAKLVTGPKGKTNFNDKIQEAGFDAIEYDFMGHIIVFDPKQIKIKSSTPLDKA